MAHCRRFDTSLVGEDFKELSFRLMNEKNYLPDILRDYTRLMEEYQHAMSKCCQPLALVDGKNRMGGVFYISDVVPGHEATLFFWCWDKGAWTATTKRAVLDYIERVAEEYGLTRVVCRTPDDKRFGKLLEGLLFKLEGRFRGGYKSGGRLSTLYQYRRLWRGGV